MSGFFAAAEAGGVRGDAGVIDGSTHSEYGDSEMADVGRLLAARIAAQRERPTGVLAVNDMLAFGLLAGFRDAGLVVPRDVSVIGMDGLYLSSLTSPGLTTVSLPVPEMARTMVERLIARLADPTVAPGEFLFKPSLVQRESVARPPEKKAKA